MVHPCDIVGTCLSVEKAKVSGRGGRPVPAGQCQLSALCHMSITFVNFNVPKIALFVLSSWSLYFSNLNKSTTAAKDTSDTPDPGLLSSIAY